METATLKLQLHYYFEDEERHSMDAFIRNDNERDVLAIIRQSIDLAGVQIRIEIVPPIEGGLIDKYIVRGKTIEVITVVLLGASLYMQRELNLSQVKLNTSQMLVNESQMRANDSQTRINNLQIEAIEAEKTKQTRELRRKLQPLETDTSSLPKAQIEKLTREISTEIVDTLSKDYKAIWHRSKFFERSYKTTNKIQKISTQILDEKDKPIDKERTAERSDFNFFVLQNNSVQSLIDKNAIIEIVSPVLNGRKFTWKGLYNGEVITFSMLDRLFIQKIQNKEVEFTNGTTIRCVLEQKRKIDDATGIIKIVKNNVLTVAPMDDKDKPLAVPRRRRGSKIPNTQLQLGLEQKRKR